VELLLNQERVAIGLLDAKELYAATEACDEANIKVQEHLNNQAIVIAHREQVVTRWE
jgi:hypothetical protein